MKNLKLLSVLVVFSLLTSCGSNNRSASSEEWKYLFNGKNLDGWIAKFQHLEVGDNYADTFRVVDGVIQVNYDGYEEFDERYGHLFYEKVFSDFHLKFEYKFTDQWMDDAPGYTYRNSGVMFHSQDPRTILKEQDWPISVEFQMLAGAGDGNPRPTGNMCSPGTEVYFEGKMDERHCINSNSDTYAWDEWVSAELIVQDTLVTHKINGEIVLQYTRPEIGGGVANRFDPAIKQDGKVLTEGYIGLQAEGQGVEFREIKIRELNP